MKSAQKQTDYEKTSKAGEANIWKLTKINRA